MRSGCSAGPRNNPGPDVYKRQALSEKVPGDRITAVFYRKGKRETVEITLDGGTLSAEEIKAKGEIPFVLPNKDSWVVSNLWTNICLLYTSRCV